MVAATVLGGFPFADIPYTSVATIVVTDNDRALAKKYANELAQICWDLREDFTIHPTPVKDAIAEALAGEPGSVYVLADISDSGASGTAGDGTAILKGLLEANATSAAVAQIMDRDAVDACIAAGVGSTVTLSVGGKHDGLHGEPVEVTGKVRLIHEGSFVDRRANGCRDDCQSRADSRARDQRAQRHRAAADRPARAPE